MAGPARGSGQDGGARRGFLSGFAAGALVAAAVALAIVALTGGFSGSADLPTDARDTIQRDYFKAVDGSTLDNASVNGMVSALKKRYHDRFSRYFDPHQLRQFDASTSGRFS